MKRLSTTNSTKFFCVLLDVNCLFIIVMIMIMIMIMIINDVFIGLFVIFLGV